MEHWNDLKKLMQSDRYKAVHKTIWEDFAVITDRCGNRFKIHSCCSIPEAKALLDETLEYETVMTVIQSSVNISILSSLLLIFNLN